MGLRNRLSFLALLLVLLPTIIVGCGRMRGEARAPTPPLPTVSGEVVPRGNRILKIALLPAERGGYDKAMRHARRAGVQAVPMTLFWDEVEKSPREYHINPNWLKIANEYYPSVGMKVSLTIGVLDTLSDRRPTDLKGKPYDDPEVVDRFDALLDYIASEAPKLQLASLSIGNEVDGVLRRKPGDWGRYASFFERTADHARSLWPGVPVGAKVMYHGAVAYSDELRPLWSASDAVMLTYYPIRSDFTVQPPEAVLADFDKMAQLASGKPLYLLEVGYPSGKACNSSEEMQAEFVHQTFLAWDRHADAVPLVAFFALTDLSPAAVQKYRKYYGVRGAAFGEFLRTLGLRTWPGKGEDKPAYRVFLAEARARGWGVR